MLSCESTADIYGKRDARIDYATATVVDSDTSRVSGEVSPRR